jgi:hypothetical protein
MFYLTVSTVLLVFNGSLVDVSVFKIQWRVEIMGGIRRRRNGKWLVMRASF